MSRLLLPLAAGLLFLSGIPGLFAGRHDRRGERLAFVLCALAGALGLFGAARILLGIEDAWELEWSGPLALSWSCDALSAFFAVPVLGMAALGSLYGLGYWPTRRRPRSAARLRGCFGVMSAAMLGVVLAGEALSFLIAWETMALAGFFLVMTEEAQASVRRAGWYYLVATHFATLILIAMFVLLDAGSGSLALEPASTLGPVTASAVFLLASLGFGTKAGLMPLHFWLPAAHSSAPSHVSALFSGVLLKVGVYGLVRVTAVLPAPPPSWGAMLLILGAISAVFGVICALGQHDLKRLLAYHSVENIGIIVMGLGLALLGRSLGRADLVVLGLAGALLHVWNHALFKGLLFLCAGAVVHAVGHREIDRMGGLARALPWTSACFLVGAVAICGLPPLNGFVSELLVYLGLLRASTFGTGFGVGLIAFGVPVLALTGALAVACFVKVYGAVFLGLPRAHAPRRAHEAPWTMRLPMLALCAGCVAIAVFGGGLVGMFGRIAAVWNGGPLEGDALALAPLRTAGAGSAVLLAFVLGVTAWARRHRGTAPTWDCGFVRPTARMQYTSSSFAALLAQTFRWVLRSREHRPLVEQTFPERSSFGTHVPDTVQDGLLVPATLLLARGMSSVRRIQHGRVQGYVLLILVALLCLLLSLLPLQRWIYELI